MAFGAILGSHANFVGQSAPCAPALGKLGRQSPRRPTGDRIILQPTAVSIGIKLAGLVSLVAIQDADTGEGLFNLIITIRLKRWGGGRTILQDQLGFDTPTIAQQFHGILKSSSN